MIEVYQNDDSYTDRYMVLIDNPDKDLKGHKPYYDISISVDGDVAHGSQWAQNEVDNLHKRSTTEYKGASYAFKKVKATSISVQAQRSILAELDRSK